ncbi:hypothetical protein AV545_22765 [Paenibacillus jamilae]|nr:hypothetical protein AV545_22765 [Paenibacillus jamilae]
MKLFHGEQVLIKENNLLQPQIHTPLGIIEFYSQSLITSIIQNKVINSKMVGHYINIIMIHLIVS